MLSGPLVLFRLILESTPGWQVVMLRGEGVVVGFLRVWETCRGYDPLLPPWVWCWGRVEEWCWALGTQAAPLTSWGSGGLAC